jgi:8-amino-7-oxononanoate synthase
MKHIMESPPGPRTVIDGREVDYFCGCGYLGFQSHPAVLEAACDALRRFGIGSATTRSGYGSTPPVVEVEKRAAALFGTEAALYYVSGYLGNAVLLSGLEDRFEKIFVDEASHFSVLDGIAQSSRSMIPFAHRDPEDLGRQLGKIIRPGMRPLIITDGVFPVSGEIAPLREYWEILRDYDEALLCVDDAHAAGVLGERGRGTFEHIGLNGKGLFLTATLSKALGGFGGVIPGTREFVQRLKERSPVPFAASLPPTPAAAAAAKSLALLEENPSIRQTLWDLVAYAKTKMAGLGFDVGDSPVPIICLKGTKSDDFARLERDLLERGVAVFYVPGGSYSSVPEGGAIRIAIFANHTRGQIDRLTDELRHLL